MCAVPASLSLSVNTWLLLMSASYPCLLRLFLLLLMLIFQLWESRDNQKLKVLSAALKVIPGSSLP